MVSALVSGSSGLGSSSGLGHCVVVLELPGKTLNSQCLRSIRGSIPANSWGNLRNCWLQVVTWGVEILLATS